MISAISGSGWQQNTSNHTSALRRADCWRGFLIIVAVCVIAPAASASSFAIVNLSVQPKMVKIYGAGGLRGLEAYQSGFLVSPDGHIVTSWSYVLDTDYITVLLSDGARYQAELIGADPRTEIAVLKIEAAELPYFDLGDAKTVGMGDRILAFSNLYGIATGNEPTSVLHGVVSAVSDLSARRGAYPIRYRGKLYILDAMTNNAGASGGALTNRRGELAGILGKELRSADNNAWINYALPIDEVRDVINDIIAGKFIAAPLRGDEDLPEKPHTLNSLGIVLVPNVLPKTPPFIDHVRPDSSAATADLQSDDLIMFVGTRMIRSRRDFVDELKRIDRDDPLSLTVLREQELIEFELKPGS